MKHKRMKLFFHLKNYFKADGGAAAWVLPLDPPLVIFSLNCI